MLCDSLAAQDKPFAINGVRSGVTVLRFMHCAAHPFEEALAVLLLLGLMSPAWCCLWLGTVPLPAHTAVGSSSVLRLPELWSNSHCMTSSCVLQGWVRAGVRILLSRVHVPHLVPLHPLS